MADDIQPDDLQKDIEETRERLAETVEALAGKLDVKGRAAGAAASAKDDVVDSAVHAADTVKRNVDPTWAAVSAASFVVAAVAWALSKRS